MVNGLEGSNPSLSANVEFLYFRLNLERSFVPRKSRFAQKGLNLQVFAHVERSASYSGFSSKKVQILSKSAAS